MAIEVKDHFYFSFSVGDLEDFLGVDTLDRFRVIERAGNRLPEFDFAFKTNDDSVLANINESINISVRYGKTKEGLSVSTLNPVTMETMKVGSNLRLIGMTGFLASLGYQNNAEKETYPSKKASEVIYEVVNRHFKTNNIEIDESDDDSMTWIQPNHIDKRFVSDVWLHSNYGNSFPVVGITMDEKFLLKDFRKLAAKQPYDWRLITGTMTDPAKDIPLDGDIFIKSRAGMINSWVGYGRKKLVFNLEDGDSELIDEEVQNIIAETDGLSRRADIESRLAKMGVLNDNCHEYYWRAYQWNISNLAVFSSLQGHAAFSGFFEPVRVLNVVEYNEDQTDTLSELREDHVSGRYIVTRVVRTLAAGNLSTVLQFCRESMNDLKGDVR